MNTNESVEAWFGSIERRMGEDDSLVPSRLPKPEYPDPEPLLGQGLVSDQEGPALLLQGAPVVSWVSNEDPVLVCDTRQRLIEEADAPGPKAVEESDMIIIRNEMWNSVDIFGPQSEIDRFKRLCLSPFPLGNVYDPSPGFDRHRVVLITTDVFDEETWNFREPEDQERDTYSFNFDTHTRFPVQVFDRLAEMFPTLAFCCECIADDDASMGHGWFNPPPGGEEFRDDYAVPKGYWTEGGDKRNAEAERGGD